MGILSRFFLLWVVASLQSTTAAWAESCINNYSCLPNQHCLKGVCTDKLDLSQSCLNDVDCGFTDMCVGGRCVLRPSPGSSKPTPPGSALPPPFPTETRGDGRSFDAYGEFARGLEFVRGLYPRAQLRDPKPLVAQPFSANSLVTMRFVDPKTKIEWVQLGGLMTVQQMSDTLVRNCVQINHPPAEFKGFQPLLTVAYKATASEVTAPVTKLESDHAHFRANLSDLKSALANGMQVKGGEVAWLFFDQNGLSRGDYYRGIGMNTRKLTYTEFRFRIGGSDGLIFEDIKSLVTRPLAVALCLKRPAKPD